MHTYFDKYKREDYAIFMDSSYWLSGWHDRIAILRP